MILFEFILCILSLLLLTKSVQWAIKYSSKIAKSFHLSEFIISFFVVAIISVFPETTISIISSFEGLPEFGLGALLGSNVADLLLVFGIIALYSAKGVKVKSEILKNDLLYVALLAMPVILGFDGRFTRLEGMILILSGIAFYMTLSYESHVIKNIENNSHKPPMKDILMLILSMGIVIASAYLTVKTGINFAEGIGAPPFLISITLISIGTCLPELIFSITAVKNKHDELALGDLIGTVVTDATIILGILALIHPFSFEPSIIYITGLAMLFAGMMVAVFMKTRKTLGKTEGTILLICYIIYLMIELFMSKGF